jgi:hypothetical protein
MTDPSIDATGAHEQPSPASQASRATLILAHPQQATLLAQVITASKLQVLGVAATEATATAGLAEKLSAPPVNDFRNAVATLGKGVILLAGSGQLGLAGTHQTATSASLRAELEELDNALDRGVKIISLEPRPSSLQQLIAMGLRTGNSSRHADHLTHVPTQRLGPWCEWLPASRGMRVVDEMIELLEAFGQPRSAHIAVTGQPSQGSLGARLLDAVDLLLRFIGEPDWVHAVYCGAGMKPGAGAHRLASQTLADLEGEISITCRFGDGRIASIFASDQAPTFRVECELFSGEGTLELRDFELAWRRLDGKSAEMPVAPGTQASWQRSRHPFVDLAAEQIGRHLDTSLMTAAAINWPAALATAQAALLSSRTGEPESPATLMKMSGL